MSARSRTIVLGSGMVRLSENQQLRILLSANYVQPKDEAQRSFFERLVIKHILKKHGATCCAATAGDLCGDKNGQPYIGEVPLEFHHIVPGSALYYIASYRHANDPAKRLRNIEVYDAEAATCVPLCKKHHKAWHTANRVAARS